MNEGKNKKVLLVIALISFAAAVAIVGSVGLRYDRTNMMGWNNDGDNYRQGKMMGRANYISSAKIDDKNQFVIPRDAAKSGELAIIVDNLEVARKKVAEIASENEGIVYSTFIAHTSTEVKNGSMVVQVSNANFDQAFEMLRNAGSQVVQESTQQIEMRNFYPTAMTAEEKTTASEENKNADTATDENGITESEIATYPSPIQSQIVQDKGYIRIVFADYGISRNIGAYNNQIRGNMMFSQYAEQDVSKVMWIGFGIKLLLLIVLIFLLVFILRKIIHNLRRHRTSKTKSQTKLSEKKSIVHVVRQTPRSRIINTKKK